MVNNGLYSQQIERIKLHSTHLTQLYLTIYKVHLKMTIQNFMTYYQEKQL